MRNNIISDTSYIAEVDSLVFSKEIKLTIYTKEDAKFYVAVVYVKENELIFRQSFELIRGEGSIEFDFKDLPSGNYDLAVWREGAEYYLEFNLYKL